MANPIQNFKKIIIVTVCELPTEDPTALEDSWKALCEHTKENHSDVVILPEMCFHTWMCTTKQKDQNLWQAAVRSHEKWISEKMKELSSAVVISSRPAIIEGTNYNEAYVWNRDQENTINVHYKHYLPEEAGVYEQSWYSSSPSSGVFDSQRSKPTISSFHAFNIQAQTHQVCGGVLLCSDMWFMQHARNYGKQGTHLLCVPRATGRKSLDKWTIGGQAAAVVSGSFVASSNREGDLFGGRGYIISPEGVLLGATSQDKPFQSVEIDLQEAVEAKKTYPRYIQD